MRSCIKENSLVGGREDMSDIKTLVDGLIKESSLTEARNLFGKDWSPSTWAVNNRELVVYWEYLGDKTFGKTAKLHPNIRKLEKSLVSILGVESRETHSEKEFYLEWFDVSKFPQDVYDAAMLLEKHGFDINRIEKLWAGKI